MTPRPILRERRQAPPLHAPEASAGAGLAPRLAWGVLLGLLLALLAGALTFDRGTWPSLVGDEATYLMQAESLAFDLDLTYTPTDFHRFVRHWGQTPEGLILQKGEESDRLVYGKPFFYAAWAAPFVRVSPTRGPFVANALLLALAAVVAARSLRAAVGWAAPLWVAVFVFASVTFAHVFWAHLDLFLASCTALGLALVFGPEGEDGGVEATAEGGGRRRLRTGLPWAAAGMLLTIVAFSRPLYATLLLPAGLAALSRRRGRNEAESRERSPARVRWLPMAGLAAGALLLVLVAVGVQESLAGSWTSYGGQRRGFNRVVGYPGIDVPAEAWDEMIRQWGNASWLKRRDLTGLSAGNLHLWAWNGLYFAAGRSVGVLPYFLPALLGFLGRPRGAARWALVAAVLLSAAAFLVIRPFNFFGGGGSLANRYLLPVYPALWFLPTRPVRPWWPLLAAAVAAPFLWPLWSAPRAYPVTDAGTFRYVSPAARELLPFETTQNHLKPGGQQPEVHHGGLWVKLLDPSLTSGADGGVLHLDGPGPASLLVGRDHPVREVELEIEAAALPLDLEGGEVVAEGTGPAGWWRYRIALDDPRAIHPMWWTEDDFYLYRLSIDPREDLDRTFAFRLRAVDG